MANLITLFVVLTTIGNLYFASSLSLPLVDPGLFVIQGVSTCGLGGGYCILSNSCLVDSDFESDTEGGHCDGLKHAFNPNADFVCCKYSVPSTTFIPTTVADDVSTDIAPPPPPTLESVINDPNDPNGTGGKTDDSTPTTARSTTTSSATKKIISPFNIASNTNKILNSIQHLLQGGRMRPSVAIQKFGQENEEVVYNDKSLVNLILLGLNATASRAALD